MYVYPNRSCVVLAVILLFAAAGAGHCQLWLNNFQFIAAPGYCAGGTVYYLMTDASTSAYASIFKTKTDFNVNYSPLLANALNPTLRDFWDYPGVIVYHEFMPSLYYITNFDQNVVFSAQWPVLAPTPSPAPPPRPPLPIARYSFNSYMPLWRLKEVSWNVPANAHVLTSESDVVAHQGASSTAVTIADAGVVIGASIVINSAGTAIRQASVRSYAGLKEVRLPVVGVYVGGSIYKAIALDYSNIMMAQTKRGSFAPWLCRFNLSNWVVPAIAPAYQQVFWFWPYVPPCQLVVAGQVPSPWGPGNTNANYSPLMQEWYVSLISVIPRTTPYKSVADLAPIPAGAKKPTGLAVYMPIMGR